MLIRVVEPNEVNLVLSHYQKTGYSKQVNPEDIVIAAFQASQIIGAVRLCPQDNYLVLWGMQVIKQYQRQKIGTALLHKCAEIIQNRACYCLPYKHLVQQGKSKK
jgi:ribosomal protein S18 acetylase RimI-like enzyme